MHCAVIVALGAALAAEAAPPALAGAPEVRIEHAAARVVVIPEARSNVSVTVHQGDPRLPRVTARLVWGGVWVDGGLWFRITGCRGGLGRGGASWPAAGGADTRAAEVLGVGRVPIAALPVVTVHTPLDASIGVSGAVWGEIAPSRSLVFSNSGCGDWTVGDVRGPATLSLAGSGDVRGGATGPLHANVAGSADVRLGAVSGGLQAGVAGSGDIDAAAVNGPVDAHIAGSGDVRIAGGSAPRIAVHTAGSGDLSYGGTAGAVSAYVVGSGDVRVARATGPVDKHVVGSGDVLIGR